MTLKRMNALSPAQAAIVAKFVNKQPVSPKSMAIVNNLFSRL